ncbi:MAG TPA: hypothetical protein VKU01_00975 [Bryobacteraceae bacterium]|nr:hypothetical protein [Bryobacteraceae bacterium]
MTRCRILLAPIVLTLLFSCEDRRPSDATPPVAKAFVGPTSLNIRQDLNPKSATVTTLKHGDRVDILEYKRRFIKVRTEAGVVGWTDTHQLLTSEQMAGLERTARDTTKMPSQGTASVTEALNMHPDPNRATPGFSQLSEGSKVEVVEHKLVPRVQVTTTEPILAPMPKPKLPRRRGKEKASKVVPPPPMPLPPLPPRNWVEMSKTRTEPDPPATPAKPPPPPKPVPMDDWYLVRTKDGKAGWVLSRMLSMSIPDEVAQYAEGHRITSYFPLGKVDDDGTIKENWLWTTINKGGEEYEYDSFRVFVWSRRHHRYETAYIQRNVVGHFPTEVNPSAENPSFTLILDEDGKLYRKTYAFNGYRVQLVKNEPADAAETAAPSSTAVTQNAQPAANKQGWFASMKARIGRLFGR